MAPLGRTSNYRSLYLLSSYGVLRLLDNLFYSGPCFIESCSEAKRGLRLESYNTEFGRHAYLVARLLAYRYRHRLNVRHLTYVLLIKIGRMINSLLVVEATRLCLSAKISSLMKARKINALLVSYYAGLATSIILDYANISSVLSLGSLGLKVCLQN